MQIAYLFCILAIFFFSTLEFTGKMIGADISPLAVTAYRFLIGSLILLVPAIFQLKKNTITLNKKDILSMALPGIINITVSMYLLQLAIFYGKALIAAILISSNSIFVSLLAFFILEEKIGKYRLIGIIAGIIGMIMVVAGNQGLDYTPAKSVSLGIIFSMMASVSFALFTVLAKKNIHKYGAVVFNCISFFVGAIVLLIVGLLLKVDLSFSPNIKNISALLYLGLFVTGFAYILYSKGLQKIDASLSSMFFLLKPVFASFLAVIILKESFSVWQGIGLFLILTGLSLEQIVRLINRLP